MNILVVAFAYNEKKYLSEMVKHYQGHGCDIFVLDNQSTDGTTEWLAENKIRTSILSTDGMFHLIKLQAGLSKAISEIKPDWVVYTGIDIVYSLDSTIAETVEKADKDGYNLIGVQHFNMYNTGEQFALPMKDHFFYARKGNWLYMIAKYQEPFIFEADSIIVKDKKVLNINGILINYGNCKPREERIDTYLRRKKAWENGLDINYGVHYREGIERDWIWSKDEMIDIRKIPEYKYIQKL